jgi:hypothetical protein
MRDAAKGRFLKRGFVKRLQNRRNACEMPIVSRVTFKNCTNGRTDGLKICLGCHSALSRNRPLIGRVRDDVPGERPRGLQEAASVLPEASVEGGRGKRKWLAKTFDFLPFFSKLGWLIFVK